MNATTTILGTSAFSITAIPTTASPTTDESGITPGNYSLMYTNCLTQPLSQPSSHGFRLEH